jgi:hypothetical protein
MTKSNLKLETVCPYIRVSKIVLRVTNRVTSYVILLVIVTPPYRYHSYIIIFNSNNHNSDEEKSTDLPCLIDYTISAKA